MKRRDIQPPTSQEQALDGLCSAFAALQGIDELRAFLRDLCTPAELEAMADRWRVVAPLQEGIPYRTIHDQSGVSATTIGRVARCITAGEGGYQRAFDRLAGLANPDAAGALAGISDERH